MTRSTFLRCFILGISLPVAQMHAQVARAVTEAGSVVGAERLKNAAELSVKDIGLSGTGQIVFILQNRGGVGINSTEKTAEKIAGFKGVSSVVSATSGKVIRTPPIQLDIYVGGTRIQSQYQASLAGEDSKAFFVTLPSNIPNCNDVRAIKVVVDPANVVPELQEDNNTVAVSVARPCPDLAIKSIEREKSGVMGETYRVKVTVINLGNAASPGSEVWGTATNDFPGPTGWPEMVPMRDLPPLAPGETFVFRPGGDQASFTNTYVKVFVDIRRKIDELNEANNLVDKKL